MKAKQRDPSDGDYPDDALHIWAENKPVKEFNNKRLSILSGPLFTLVAHDQYPQKATQSVIRKALERGDNGGLDYKIAVKVGARVMWTTNLDVDDRLINGQMGTIVKIKCNRVSNKPEVIYLKLDYESAGRSLILKSGDYFAIENNFVPIRPVVSKIKLKLGKKSSSEIQRTQFP